jgi:parallel beta-helix repeat protein
MKKRILFMVLAAVIMLNVTVSAAITGTEEPTGILRTINVSTAQQLDAAISNALAGDEIILAPGTYNVTRDTSGISTKWDQREAQLRARNRSGTAQNPIVLRSADSENPAHILNERTATGITLHIWGGDYWIIQDLIVEGGQKGILLDDSNHSIIRGNFVHGVGMEAVHLRDGSSHCIIINNRITNTGLVNAGFGEGVYIGSANTTTAYNWNCDHNVISNNLIGPGISADPVDIKEGSTGTIVEYNIMRGAGITGANSATSHIMNRGDDTVIRFNRFYRDQNSIVRAAIEIHSVSLQGRSWGNNIRVYGNHFYLDDPSTWTPANPNHPVFAAGIWGGSMFVGSNYVEDVLITQASNPLLPGRTLRQFNAMSGSTLTWLQAGTYSQRDPSRESGLLPRFGDIPPTGVKNLSLYLSALFALSALSAVLWNLALFSRREDV